MSGKRVKKRSKPGIQVTYEGDTEDAHDVEHSYDAQQDIEGDLVQGPHQDRNRGCESMRRVGDLGITRTLSHHTARSELIAPRLHKAQHAPRCRRNPVSGAACEQRSATQC